jgi:hypothetical protein
MGGAFSSGEQYGFPGKYVDFETVQKLQAAA